jgi:ribosome-associated protein
MIPVDTQEPADEAEYSGPSKSQLKRDMTALQALGGQLVSLSADQLKKITLPDNLRAAVRDAQRFTKHEAKRRQMQYIGKLMRGVDAAPIITALDEINGVSAAANARQHRLEQLRTRLLEDETVIGDIVRDHPAADVQLLRQLRRNTLKERESAKPPRAYRELFKVLREIQNSTTEDAENFEETHGGTAGR